MVLDIKERCIEAVETIYLMPGGVGPRFKSGFWPAIEGEVWDYAPDQTKVRRLPTAGEIARCDEFTDWVNQLESEFDRRQVWQWGRLKVKHDRTIRGYCEKLGLKEHGYRRYIDKIFQQLEENSRIKHDLRQNQTVDANSFQGDTGATSEKSPNYWRAPDAQVTHDPKSEDHKSLIKRLLNKKKRVGA